MNNIQRIHYQFFDKTFSDSSHKYNIREDENNHNNTKIVLKNRNLVAKALNIKDLVFMRQMHSNNAIYIDKSTYNCNYYIADAIITDKTNLGLCVQTADCVPVLLFTENVVSAIHAGWRGAFNGIIQNTATIMQKLDKKNQINAVIGPSILQHSYEIDLDFYTRFVLQNPKNRSLFVSSTNHNNATHFMFNLRKYVTNILDALKIRIYDDNEVDTYSNPEKYFSYRKAMHEGVQNNGSLLSVIMLKK